ncbi:hypothetical protein [Nocardia sp. NPDC051750]|uniref:hypothetical protein n=1 Tax=Nocardia sp. NPDC051750 TaxID=3364325 RepID=UPI0037BB32A6
MTFPCAFALVHALTLPVAAVMSNVNVLDNAEAPAAAATLLAVMLVMAILLARSRSLVIRGAACGLSPAGLLVMVAGVIA